MNSKILKRLTLYIAKYKKYAIFSLISAIISVIGSLVGPMLIGKGIDQMFGKGNVNFSGVTKILILLAIVYAISNIFNWLLTYSTNLVSYQSVNDMRMDLFKKINTLPLKFFDNNPHGDTITRFVTDMETISDGMLQALSTFISGVITIVGAIIFMLCISKLMTLVVIILSPASYFMAKFITNRSQKLFKEQANVLGKLNGYTEEIIGGQKVVKAFNYEATSTKKFKEINSKLYNAGVKSQFYGSLSGPTTRIVNNVTYALIGIIGSLAAISGKLTIGDISSFLIYSALFAKPLNDITSVFTQVQAAAASAERVFTVLDMDSEKADSKDSLVLKDHSGEINFNEVGFSYVAENPLIRDFNLNVKPGTKIAIVGQTGAGKTTIVNLLMRFYEVSSGSISIAGKDIREYTRDSLRQNFGMVLQDTWLFSGTIRDNISYGKANAKEEEIIEASKAAGAHSFIKKLPHGYDTVISDAGENLSQGQKQLLTIARVMLVDAPMLILDEATSNIDTRTELKIQEAFLKMLKNRTSFIIAHRLSTIKESDLILVMKNGNVMESGSHEELLKRNGEYSKLYNSQFAKTN